MKNLKLFQYSIYILILILLFFLPSYAPDVLMQFSINVLLLSVLAQSWNLIGGYTNYVSFGNSVFYGLGNYCTAIAIKKCNFSFGISLIFSILLVIFFAILIGGFIFRLKGHYFAVTTLALSQVTMSIVSNIKLTGKNIGLIIPVFNNDTFFYEISLLLLIIITLNIYLLTKSKFILGLMAIRENEENAVALGINTTFYKILMLIFSGTFTALAGSIYAYWVSFVNPSAFDTSLNVRMILITVLGGLGTTIGPIIGTFLFLFLSEIMVNNLTGIANIFLGFTIIILIIIIPNGFIEILINPHKINKNYFIKNIQKNKL
ncbi:branched-chain amino acid ABC transporter permease, LivH homolog [Candidatus Profftella armatura (Diaphorina cf. continua)]|uniref:Branched-chain amino acid ABC transporter permease, LivH homolog n=1 Tax=Candidatus Profftella armatura (Diaphorina cf. continua) TaxID=2661583 RepID=A0A7R7AB05_9PROT|nr:branched-chain amino acid ABC transporter permease [Candidatus Profftella armatura (Diaphorina cf. continua)]BCG49550.1 branched-chain amino acid ABC transporter permease, LivH homolog [Candidatus Profftella armatura (Diaphorina cf. continua)]